MVKWDDEDGHSDVRNGYDGNNEKEGETGVGLDMVTSLTPADTRAGSLYDGASTTKGGSTAGDDSLNSSQEIGGRETTRVTYLRLATLMVLFLAAGIVSTAVFLITKQAQTDEFETEFEGVAAKVLETFEEIVSEKLAALSSFSVSITSYARSHNMTFPFVTMKDYQQRAGSIREVVDCLLVYSIYAVTGEQKADWENYTQNEENNQWIANDLAYQAEEGINTGIQFPWVPFIYRFGPDLQAVPEDGPAPYAPIWQSSPLFTAFPNFNVRTFPPYQRPVSTAIDTGKMTIGGILTAPPGDVNTPYTEPGASSTILYALLLGAKMGKDVTYNGDPMAYVALPIYDNFDKDNRKAVGTVSAIMNWAVYFQGVVPPRSPPVTIVLENPCDGPYTYQADNGNVEFQGKGDLHNGKYNHLERRAQLNTLLMDQLNQRRQYNALDLDELGCPYNIRVYPTQEMEDENDTAIPLITTLAIAVTFAFTAAIFCLYNNLVETRQKLVLSQAKQSSELVSSFLPQEVQNRLLKDKDGNGGKHVSSISRLKSFLSEGNDTDSEPIADLFPFCTVLFADIAGFTAWSSTREPAQVFVLLQTVYQAFDVLAKKHKVFKVETIGDCYVAVTGIPNEQKMHAIYMARFAGDCVVKMNSLVKELERTLGPDTGDLYLRIGLNSGPVTAGVLRGDRPRFQLFGDTVNTAARIESTGMRNRIHASHTTASEIEKLGKGHWLTKREDAVVAKGKGILETYWIETSTIQSGVPTKVEQTIPNRTDMTMVDKQNRLVDWCVEILLDSLRKIQALRQGLFLNQTATDDSLIYSLNEGRTCMDEVKEKIALPPYDAKAANILATTSHRDIEIDPDVVSQLRKFVAILCQAYRSNAFHNFEHACHVTMSVDKFLKRIVSPNMDGDIKSLHEYTHGLTSDPLLHMAIVLSAVIHDVDHYGISNVQLAKEEPQMAQAYHGQSIAEQNSLDLSWTVFMGPEFRLLRRAMFVDRSAMLRFRQVVVNIVLATDIFDKDLNALRKKRWDKAFAATGAVDNNLRATIVMEHIIQASDVSHTMQHWHIYRKWNERLFMEMTQAYHQGRMGKDPAEFWYQGELGFFDNYIIPLAKKLKECNVFGVSSDEVLNYALQNRREWEHRGREVVQELIEKARLVHAPPEGPLSAPP